MRLIAYDIQSDERIYLLELNKNVGADIIYTEETLNIDTVELAKGCQGASILSHSKITTEILQQLKCINMLCISTRTYDYHHIDMDYAEQIGIKVLTSQYDFRDVASVIKNSDDINNQKGLCVSTSRNAIVFYSDAIVRSMLICSVSGLISSINAET